jgi:hypothetical protein
VQARRRDERAEDLRARVSIGERLERFLAGRAAPVVAGIITALCVAYVWGGLNGVAAYHDERAYLVQARLLSHFTWTAPAPPLSIFFEMPHLFVEPRIFARYPPGHAPLLVPGIWLGLPGLMPVLLAGLSGALTFLIARRLAGAWVALGAWGIWTVAPKMLDWHSSYFSESTTSVLWLSVLLALIEWRANERRWLLAAIVGGVAWMGITRPVTGIALGIPIAVVVIATAWRRRSLLGWQQGAVVGALICALVPYWSWTTLGSPTRLPYAEYSAWYFPFDMPGFVRDSSPPLRELPPDFEALASATRNLYSGHLPSAMPGNFVTRAYWVTRHSLGPIAEPLVALIPLGMVAMGAGVSLFAAASFGLLVAAYLVMPHATGWTIYYLEIFPLVPFFAMAGFAWFARLVWAHAASQRWTLFTPRVLRGAALLVPAFLIGTTSQRLPMRRDQDQQHGAHQRMARDLIAGLPDPRAVVFVRRTSPMSPHFTLWDVLGDPATTPTWIVRDLGDARNAELVALAGERTPYLLDEVRMTIVPYAP